MEKYASSENLFNRQMVARTVLDTLRQVVGNQDEVDQVLAILARLGEDVEPPVRAELMEQVPHIAMYCQEVPDQLYQVVPLHLLPLVVKFLTDKNNQVRKTSQAALLVLLEQGLVERSDVEQQVCPVIIKFTEADSLDDYRTEAVALLSKMAPMIGREMSERLFLDRFAALCVDPLFHIRKVCAANFGDFSGVVGPESTEKILLPKFFYLCEDGVWGVRKACADVFMPVSCVCSPTIRQTELSPLFINLLKDQSRWVRMAAFQALGPFISTFADPAITALLHNENGEIIITDPDQLAHRLNILEQTRSSEKEAQKLSESTSTPASSQSIEVTSPQLNTSSSQPTDNNNHDENKNEESSRSSDENTVNNNVVLMDEREDEWSSQLVAPSSPTSAEERRASLYFESSSSNKNDNSDFNTFLYWREPVPSLDLVDIDLDAGDTLDDTEMVDVENQLESMRQDFTALDVESSTDDDDDKKNAPSTAQPGPESVPIGASAADDDNQDIVKENTEDETSEAATSLQDGEKNKTDESSETKDDQTAKVPGSDAKTWTDVPVITFEKFDNITGALDSTMYGSILENQENISTFDPQNRWGSYASLHSSRSSLDSRSADVHPPDPALPKGPPETDQSIVPQLLIDHYVSMIDPSRAQTVDNDIARHCAFSLPAVALTLGRSNWPLLKVTYETLANDMQWKVRRTVASSIHELGVILGEEVATQDLVPIFNGLIKDLDEVRIGILKHLADFLKLLQEKERNEYLPKLEEFLKLDNERNWRFRLELAEQLGLLVGLFTASDVKTYLAPIALTLIQDKVSAVRMAAIVVVSNMIETQDPELNKHLIAEVADKLAHSTHWSRRQTFAALCGQLVTRIPYSLFSEDLLGHLLDLTWDEVPNVRMQVARVLGQTLPEEYYVDTSLPHREFIVSALEHLAEDKDADVREAAASGQRVVAKAPEKPKKESEPEHTTTTNTTKEEGEGDPPSWAQIAAK